MQPQELKVLADLSITRPPLVGDPAATKHLYSFRVSQDGQLPPGTVTLATTYPTPAVCRILHTHYF